MNKKKTKIIHVHFFSGHKNYYFGSVTAIFKMFTSKEIGCTEAYLRHQLTEAGNHYINAQVWMASTHKGRSHPFLPYHKATFPIPGILKYAEIFIALKTLAIVENERFAPLSIRET